jgi:hypothetical protein
MLMTSFKEWENSKLFLRMTELTIIFSEIVTRQAFRSFLKK